jgi:transcriptional regulator with XRE-family HTH domain
MRKLPRVHSKIALEALTLFGLQIKQTRKQLRMTERDLAERMGVSRTTLQKIEKGEPFVEIGLAFEAAVLLGLPLFDIERSSLGSSIERVQDKLALLPKAIRRPRAEIDDDF